MFSLLSRPFHLQFQGFGTTSHTPTRAPPSTEQSNISQSLSYYQQSHEAVSKGYNNEKTINLSEVTVSAVSKFSAPDKHTCIVSSFLKTEKAFYIPCLIGQNKKIIGLEQHQTQAD